MERRERSVNCRHKQEVSQNDHIGYRAFIMRGKVWLPSQKTTSRPDWWLDMFREMTLMRLLLRFIIVFLIGLNCPL